MRLRRILYVVLVVIAVVLLLPLYSYSPSEKSSVTIKLKASLAEGSHQATYSISFDEGSSSYLDHVGVWWNEVLNPVPQNPTPGPEVYPIVCVSIKQNWGFGFDSNGNPIPPTMENHVYSYQFGRSWQFSETFTDVPSNGQIKVTVLIYWSAEMSDGGLEKTYVA
jgi:hypothetical protein